jgi:hypothetical protein
MARLRTDTRASEARDRARTQRKLRLARRSTHARSAGFDGAWEWQKLGELAFGRGLSW